MAVGTSIALYIHSVSNYFQCQLQRRLCTYPEFVASSPICRQDRNKDPIAASLQNLGGMTRKGKRGE